MTAGHGTTIVALACFASACGAMPAPETTAEWDGPLYEVTLSADDPEAVRIVALLPTAPRSLRMSDYGAGQLPDGWATFVHDLVATDGAVRRIGIETSAPREWRLAERPAGGIRLAYSVHLAHDTVDWPGGIDGAALSLPWGAFFSGRSVFVVADSSETPVRVAFRTSPGWGVAASWPSVSGTRDIYEAATPRSLTESYTFVGEHEAFEIERNGLVLAFALGGPSVVARADEFRATADDVHAWFTRMLGGPPRPAPGEPGGRVLAIINEGSVTDGEVIGSHINILLEPEPDPLGLLFSRFGLVHELFHLWNGKSIRSDGPEDWFSEGFTNYYALRAMRQTEMLDDAKFFDVLGSLFHARYVGDEGYGVLSMRDAVRAKDGHWGLIYAGGLFTALCQDVEIRRATANRRSLDDVMRTMYERFAGAPRTYDVEDVEAAIRLHSGRDPSDFFERHVFGSEPVPIADCLSEAGLDTRIEGRRLRIEVPENLGELEAGIVAGMLGEM